MSLITNINAYMVLDSRGWPTVACELTLDNQSKGSAYVPSGASTGQYEAHELRDGDETYYHGRGVKQAIGNICNTLNKFLINKKFDNQKDFDQALKEFDGSMGYQRLGANAILALSLAYARASAEKNKLPLYASLTENETLTLPIPMMNVINGGAHADNNLDIQEFMLVPHGFDTFAEAMQAGCEVYHRLRAYLKNKNYVTAVGDEGGFAPNIDTPESVLDMLSESVVQSGYALSSQISFALDIAASEFYQDGQYVYNGQTLDGISLSSVWQKMINDYPIISIEDPMADDDIHGWKHLTQANTDQCLIVGDDLLVTAYDRLQQGIHDGWMNSILIKPNQVGTLSETLATIQLAKSNHKAFIISHRSGETEDSFIADLAVSTQAPFIKTGAPCRSERLAKYNRLLYIAQHAECKLHSIKALLEAHG